MEPASGEGDEETETLGLFIGTEGHCYLCMNAIASEEPVVDPPTHSLQNLSRYLKLNLGEVLHAVVPDQPQKTRDMLERSAELRAVLCEGCAPLNDRFSELCGQLERIRMEVAQCLGGIQGKLIQAVEGGTAEELQRWMKEENIMDEIFTLRIGEKLREQAILKCAQEVNSTSSTQTENSPATSSSGSDSDSAEGDTDNVDGVSMATHSTLMQEDQEENEVDIDNFLRVQPQETPTPPPSPISPACYHTFKVAIGSGKYHRWYQCKLCEKKFRSCNGLHLHHKSVHQKLRHKCPLCDKKFTQPKTLSQHHQVVHQRRKFQCRSCKAVFSWKGTLMTHLRQSDGACWMGNDEIEAPTETQIQNRSNEHELSSLQSSDFGENLTFDQVNSVGDNEDISGRRPDDDDDDMDDDTASVPIIAGVSYANVKQELFEMTAEEAVGPGPVEVERYRPIIRRIPHQRHQNGRYWSFIPATGKYQCKVCRRLFSTRYTCYGHHRNVHQKRRHKCPFCDKQFNQPSSLSRHHKSVHLGMEFRCRTCHKRLKSRIGLVYHQRQSRGACRSGKNEIEEVVSGTTENENGLSYIRGERNFLASTTGEYNWQLSEETREGPLLSVQNPNDNDQNWISFKWECGDCGSEFETIDDLQSHKDSVHSGIWHRCGACHLSFSQEDALRLHQIKFCHRYKC